MYFYQSDSHETYLDEEEITYQVPVGPGEDNSSTLPRAYGYISSHSRNEGLPVYENSQPISPPQPPLSGILVVIISNHV